MNTPTDTHYLFLGIDPSITNTGLCILHLKQQPNVYLYDITKCGKKISKDKIERYIDITNVMLSMIINYINDNINQNNSTDNDIVINLYIGYEDYSFHSTHKAFSLGELGGCLKTGLYRLTTMKCINSMNTLYVPPTKLKKFATKDGTVPKELMISSFLNTYEINNTGSTQYIYNNNLLTKNKNDTLRNLSNLKVSSDCADAYFLAEYALVNSVARDQLPDTELNRYEVLNLRNKLEVVSF